MRDKKTAKFWLNFRYQWHLTRWGFATEQHISNLKTSTDLRFDSNSSPTLYYFLQGSKIRNLA